ncbi:TylF/MycF family methyltransferase [Billgrantia zhangzhouensis]|uniref:TylF/MycF family methyltransferase n=1 Tax=Billgrantia zhangzhouensis TaxID=2733481 RepID=UPI001F3B8CFE
MNRFIVDDWVRGVLGVANPYSKESNLRFYYDYLIRNHDKVDGDIVEAGVYKGSSLLATALLLKQLGSKKKVYGFDSFAGFPSYHYNDSLEKFDELYEKGVISKKHFSKVKKNISLRERFVGLDVNASNISMSGDFSDTSKLSVEMKADLLNLDNIILIDGSFSKTMVDGVGPDVVMSALIDCDLYEGYKISLPYLWERLSPGGYVYLDEYYSLKFPGARIACDEFFSDKTEKPFKNRSRELEFERWSVIKGM